MIISCNTIVQRMIAHLLMITRIYMVEILGGGGGGKEHTTFSEMNTRKWIHMPPIHGRQVIEKLMTIDNTRLSYSQMENIETIKVPTGLESMCPPVVVAHLSMAGLHLMENIQWIEKCLRATVGVLQVNGMGMVVGIPPLVVGPVTGHLAGTNMFF